MEVGAKPIDDPDAQLMLAFQRGDETAFDALFERHRERVVNTAYRLLGDANFAQDVAQEVFVRIYTRGKDYRPSAAFTTWLYRITANASLDEIRKRKRLRHAAPDDLSEDTADPSPTPEARAQSRELAREVRAALSSLPDNQRLALVLQRYEGLSYQQIAQVLQTSVSAVESLLFRAKNTLRTRLLPYVDTDQMADAATPATPAKEKV